MDRLNEMALYRQDALERCIGLGKKFVEHFDKIYNNRNSVDVEHWKKEMEGWWNQVKDIQLKPSSRRIYNVDLIDWFFDGGESAINFMTAEDKLTERDVYEEFEYRLLGRNITVTELIDEILLKENRESMKLREWNERFSRKRFNEDFDDMYRGEVREYYCPLEIVKFGRYRYDDYDDEGEPVPSSRAKQYRPAIRRALDKEQNIEGLDPASMANYQDNPKVEWVSWDVDVVDNELCGVIIVGLNDELFDEEEKELMDWISGQNSDGFGEGFEQTDIDVADGTLNVSFWQPRGYFLEPLRTYRQ